MVAEDPDKKRDILAEIQAARKRAWHNLDWTSTLSFVGAAIIGAIGAANNVRHNFWESFVLGFGKVRTPFADITDKYNKEFQKVADAYQAPGGITSKQYCDNMRDTANHYRDAVGDKLLKEFDIPSRGPTGWTLGTFRRMKELSLTGRIQSVVNFAAVAAISFGAISVLRNSRDTIDRIEDKIDVGSKTR